MFMTESQMRKSPKWYAPDLRNDFNEKRPLSSGILYRKDNVLQVWWSSDVLGRDFKTPEKGRETWTFPSQWDARKSFIDFEE